MCLCTMYACTSDFALVSGVRLQTLALQVVVCVSPALVALQCDKLASGGLCATCLGQSTVKHCYQHNLRSRLARRPACRSPLWTRVCSLVDMVGDSRQVYKAVVELVRAMWTTLPHPVPTFQDLLLCALRRHLIMALHTSHSEHLFRYSFLLGLNLVELVLAGEAPQLEISPANRRA